MATEDCLDATSSVAPLTAGCSGSDFGSDRSGLAGPEAAGPASCHPHSDLCLEPQEKPGMAQDLEGPDAREWLCLSEAATAARSEPGLRDSARHSTRVPGSLWPEMDPRFSRPIRRRPAG